MNISESWLDIYEYSSWMEATFIFIYDTLKQFFSVIFSRWLFWFPMLAILLLGLGYVAVWLVLETTNYTHGSNYANPNRQFGRMANPNRQYETKMPLWSAIGQKMIRQHNQKQREQEKQAVEAANSKLAEEFFHNNPNAYKINIDGRTFWREGWQKHRWDKDGRMRHTISYKREGNEYIPVKESHSVTEYDDPD